MDEIEFIDSTTWIYNKLENMIISYKDGNWGFIDDNDCPSIVTLGGDITEMEAASSDTLWLCYDVAGIHYYLKSTNVMTYVNNTQGARNMVLDGNDVWFTKEFDHALYRYDGSSVSMYDYTFTNLPDTFFLDIRKGLNDDIWALTREELVKYDGVSWTTYNLDLPFTLSPNTYTVEIDVDNNGNVWLTAPNKELAKFDGTNWTTYNIWNSTIPGNDMQTLFVASNGDLWMGIANVGLVHYDWVNYEVIDIFALTGWSASYLEDINEDIYGNIWVAPQMNVFVYNPNGLQGYLGVDENNTESLIVYPNPSKNGMYSVDTGGTQFEYTIYSLDGKIITQGLSNGRINLEKQPKGIYILGVTTSKETFKSKLVID